ncbi:MAG: hypothetical protein ABID04_01745 [Patescibacteria group bacterium]
MKTKKKKKINLPSRFVFALHLSFGVSLGILFLLLLVFGWTKYLLKERQEQELIFWKQVSLEDPGYPDAWAQMAVLNYNQGKKTLSRLLIKKACRLDPIREELKELKEKIQ